MSSPQHVAAVFMHDKPKPPGKSIQEGRGSIKLDSRGELRVKGAEVKHETTTELFKKLYILAAIEEISLELAI